MQDKVGPSRWRFYQLIDTMSAFLAIANNKESRNFMTRIYGG